MKSLTIVGVLLVVLGVLALVFQGFTYTRQKKIIDIGPIEATRETKERIPLAPIVGVVVLTGGVILLVAGARQKA